MLLKLFVPDMYQKDIFKINYDKLKKENIKCLLFDLDNTISPAKEVVFNKDIKSLFDKLKKHFKVIIFSNNFPSRVKKFGEYYSVDIACICLKPLRYKYKYIMKKYNYKKSEIASIGDQLLTDIQGGNKVGIKTILVNPISKIDETETFLNRKIEKLIFQKFEKKKILVKEKYYE